MTTFRRPELRFALALFGLGFIGILSALPLVPLLIALRPEPPPIPVPALQLASTLQSSLFLAGFVALGLACAKRVGLRAPILAALARGESAASRLKRAWAPALATGIAGGLAIVAVYHAFMPHLPSDFLAASGRFAPPWYTRLLYGGITEEILVRWGLMSFFAWGLSKLQRPRGERLGAWVYVAAILLSALLFGVGHLPVASLLSTEPTPALVAYIILGNALFGILAGFLFWRRGLESAMLAHMTAHLVMIAANGVSNG